MHASYVLLGAVGVERIVELVVSHRHARALLARGGIEHGGEHYPAMVALHASLLAGCLLEPRLAPRPVAPVFVALMIVAVAAAQSLRWWAIMTLGERWSTRVIVLPGASRVRRGPYRYFAHPNYFAVMVEGLALPLACSAWWTALVFTLLDAWLLRMRLRVEVAALDAAEVAS